MDKKLVADFYLNVDSSKNAYNAGLKFLKHILGITVILMIEKRC